MHKYHALSAELLLTSAFLVKIVQNLVKIGPQIAIFRRQIKVKMTLTPH